MSRENLNGSDKLNVAYQKINDNFIELYAGGGGGGGGGATDLKDLADVQITLPIADDQALVYDTTGNKWKNQAIPRDLGDLSSVDLTLSPLTTYQVLQWNGTKWVNSKVTVDELNDVTLTTPANNDVLQYDGTKWINSKVNVSELGDATISSPTTGQVLEWNGNAWVNGGIDLDQLSDTIISSPASGQVLEYNGTNWVNGTIDLDQLSDVVITTPQNFDYLRYDNMNNRWVNSVAGFQSQQGFEIERVYSKTRLLMGVV